MRLPAGLPAGLPAAVALAAVVAGCGSPPTASTPFTAQTPVYVLNFRDYEQGRPDQRPANLVLSEFSTMSGVTWRTWGPTRATGAGKLSGTWCLPECADAPYDAMVTLSGVVPVKGKGYFSRYAVTADVPARHRAEADLSGVLPTP